MLQGHRRGGGRARPQSRKGNIFSPPHWPWDNVTSGRQRKRPPFFCLRLFHIVHEPASLPPTPFYQNSQVGKLWPRLPAGDWSAWPLPLPPGLLPLAGRVGPDPSPPACRARRRCSNRKAKGSAAARDLSSWRVIGRSASRLLPATSPIGGPGSPVPRAPLCLSTRSVAAVEVVRRAAVAFLLSLAAVRVSPKLSALRSEDDQAAATAGRIDSQARLVGHGCLLPREPQRKPPSPGAQPGSSGDRQVRWAQGRPDRWGKTLTGNGGGEGGQTYG